MQPSPLATIAPQRILCETTGRLYLEITEVGVGAWCSRCHKPHILPRDKALALLLGDKVLAMLLKMLCENGQEELLHPQGGHGRIEV